MPSPSALPNAPIGPAVLALVDDPGAPVGIATTRDGHVLVGTGNGTAAGVTGPSKLFELDGAGRQVGVTTIRGQKPGHEHGLGAVAVHPVDGSAYVVDVDSSRILRIDLRTHVQATAAVIPDAPPCLLSATATPCEPGVVAHVPMLSGMAFDERGDLFVADAGQATIWRIRQGSSPEAWYQSLDLATGDGPAGLSISTTGAMTFTAGTTLDPAAPNTGALYTLSRNTDGSAGTRTLVMSFEPDARPGPLTEDITGATYVVLRGSRAIARIASGEAVIFSTRGTSVPLDSPAGLSTTGGRLLVTNRGTGAGTSRPAVLSFPLT